MGVHKNSVYKAWKAYQACGTTDYAPKPGRPKGKDRVEKKDEILARITEDPNVSTRSLSRQFGMAEKTMRRVVKQDLRLKSLAKVQIQQLTAQQRQKRLDMRKKMINKLKGEARGKVVVFSDEKDFHLTKHHNRRNDRTIARSSKEVEPSNRFVGRPKFPQKAMFFGFVGSDGKAFPGVWIRGNMDGAMYKNILQPKVIPLLDRTYGAGNYIWMQDGASSHTCKAVMNYLNNKLGPNGYWSKGIWLPNFYDLNPLDYSILSWVDSKANSIYHPNLEAMKLAVEREWNSMSVGYVRDTCARFRPRLEACVMNDGGVFEKD